MKKLLYFVLLLSIILSFATGVAARDYTYEQTLAVELKELGVFRGVAENDFALDRAPTRVEALVMLIRALGKEKAATEGAWTHPFTDVPQWADAYVGYAYVSGLTNGSSATQFGTGDASAAMYLTFMLSLKICRFRHLWRLW